MATVVISENGTIGVTLSEQEQTIAAMIHQEHGENHLTQIFNLWFMNASKEIINTRFGRLENDDQADVLKRMSSLTLPSTTIEKTRL